MPWPDEGSFVWQALAFRDNWSLFAPELHPGRDVLWMPPGFMVLEGTIFKILPFSLNLSRTLSAMFLCGAFGCLAACVRHYGCERSGRLRLAGRAVLAHLWRLATTRQRLRVDAQPRR